jgi:hypothetical protein
LLSTLEIQCRVLKLNLITSIAGRRSSRRLWHGEDPELCASTAQREDLAIKNHLRSVDSADDQSIAHEVKQPIAGTLTNAKAALRWLDDDGEAAGLRGGTDVDLLRGSYGADLCRCGGRACDQTCEPMGRAGRPFSVPMSVSSIGLVIAALISVWGFAQLAH